MLHGACVSLHLFTCVHVPARHHPHSHSQPFETTTSNNKQHQQQVAARPEDDEWILARVQSYDITTGVYTVVDEDDVSKTFEVAEAATHLLDTDRVTKGEPVFAIYPVRVRARVCTCTCLYSCLACGVKKEKENSCGV